MDWGSAATWAQTQVPVVKAALIVVTIIIAALVIKTILQVPAQKNSSAPTAIKQIEHDKSDQSNGRGLTKRVASTPPQKIRAKSERTPASDAARMNEVKSVNQSGGVTAGEIGNLTIGDGSKEQ